MSTEVMRRYLDIINEQIGISTQVDITKDLGNGFYLASFKDTKEQGVLDKEGENFITYKNGQFTSHQVRGNQISSQYGIQLGPMTRAAFEKSGIHMLQGPGINPGNRPSPADTFAQPNFNKPTDAFSPKPK